MRPLLILLLLSVFYPSIRAQKVLLFEKGNSPSVGRMSEGETIRFRMKGDKFWQAGPIREMRPDIQALVINDRFIMLDEIEMIDQGTTLANPIGGALVGFGVGWSFWAVAGNYTDGDPTTRYETRDLMISLASIGSGLIISKLFGKKRFKVGKKKRLRIIEK